MASRPNQSWIDPQIRAYVAARAGGPDEIQRELIEETARATGNRSVMQVSPDEGRLLSILAGVTNAKLAVEVGTFTGYSALCIARAMGPGSRLVCCDVSEEWTSIGRKYWERAEVADRIDLYIGPAAETLRTIGLPVGGVDLAFLDADKTNYRTYYEILLPLMRPGGLIMVDNTLWGGRVVDRAAPDDADTKALQEFNDAVAADVRVESYLLPVCDGLTLIRTL